MADLVPMPVLDIRNEALLAAQMIARVSGALTIPLCDRYIDVLREYRAMLEEGVLPVPPVCPELSNANPSSPHTVLIEQFALLVAFVTRAINQVPDQNRREFARLFKIELREATAATTTLLFTAEPPGVAVTIPAGTQARAAGGIAFATDEELTILDDETEGSVSATSIVTGVTLLAPNTITEMVDQIAFVTGVTNPDAVESGSAVETIESAMARARNYQRRGERLVSGRDLEDAILEDALSGNGVVKAWPFIKDGDWSEPYAGHTTVIVMTRTGHAFSDEIKQLISAKMKEAVGSQFIYIKDPTYVDFTVTANVKLSSLVTQSIALAAAATNLQNFYAARAENFGRTISRSEIIAIIEGTEGIDRIEPQVGGAILAAPIADVDIAPYELPRLGAVALTVVA